VQHYHKDTRRPLTEEESKKIPSYNIFDLYVDPIVDRVIPEIQQVLKINPIDESLLFHVFEKNRYKTIKAFGANLMLPNVEVLLATKINSVLKRQKDHKRFKDVADIYALIWHSGVKTPALQRRVLQILDRKQVVDILVQLTDSDFEEAGKALDLPKDEISRVINSFIPFLTDNRTMSSEKDSENNSRGEETRWRIPFNTSYDNFMTIVKALYKLHADTKRVSLDDLESITRMNRHTLSLNLTFLRSVGITESDGDGLKLTELGSRYAKARVGNDVHAIREISKEFIGKSHLRSLQHYIELQKELKPRQLYDYIKAEGRFSDGTGPTGLSVPWAGGARILLRIFKDAGILPEDFEIDARSAPEERITAVQKGASQKPSSKSKSIPQRKSQPVTGQNDTAFEVQQGYLGRIAVKGVGIIDINDEDTLRLAESALQILRKKIEGESKTNNINQEGMND